MTGSQRRMKAITAAVRVLLLPLLALAAPQGQAVAVKGDLQGYSHHSLTADDPCSSPAFVPSDVSQETLEAQRNFCTTLKVRRKRQTVQFGQESLRDIASSATALGSILGTPGSNDSNVPLIFPDTKWCGEGTIAANYNDLGKEQFADMCCRAHDHCPQSLDSFAYNSAYDLKNPIGYTLSSCDCDTEFRRCLDTNANSGLDWVSGLIKDIFENVLRTPCMKYMHPLKCVGSTSS
ncbi:unnamed protein product [Notodromas monacha]|uniref:Phospholipase A2-like central domain-containing protein n=1 Tax=Notodromas monacha TaxID=399045 RepID=A0A7R9C1W5_9CRUS|nr:unnamed protein product [Notodromas monacha]CAG0924872.1 unnamed protein product [Notodromas monacha]